MQIKGNTYAKTKLPIRENGELQSFFEYDIDGKISGGEFLKRNGAGAIVWQNWKRKPMKK